MNTPTLSLTIGGRTYRLAVNAGQETNVKAVAANLDAILNEMKKADPLMDRDQMLILAAIQLASEASDVKSDADEQATSVMRFHRELATRLEQLLPTA